MTTVPEGRILTAKELKATVKAVKQAFPHIKKWEWINEVNDEYFGFTIWGEYTFSKDRFESKEYYITIDVMEHGWNGYFSIGQHVYMTCSADFGDAHLAESKRCDNLTDAIASLKSEIRRLCDAFA